MLFRSVHGLYALPEDRRAKRAVVYSLERIAAACSDAELIQNPEDIDTLRRIGIPTRKLRLLGNGVDLARFRPADPTTRAAVRAELGIPEEAVVCGVVGRLVWEKGYREVFAAAAALRARHPEVLVLVVGPDDPEKADGVDAASLARAEADGVRLLGMRAESLALCCHSRCANGSMPKPFHACFRNERRQKLGACGFIGRTRTPSC